MSRDAEYTTLLRLEAGVRFRSHSHPAGEELFVVDGRIRIEGTWHESGWYIYSPPGASTTCSRTPGY